MAFAFLPTGTSSNMACVWVLREWNDKAQAFRTSSRLHRRKNTERPLRISSTASLQQEQSVFLESCKPDLSCFGLNLPALTLLRGGYHDTETASGENVRKFSSRWKEWGCATLSQNFGCANRQKLHSSSPNSNGPRRQVFYHKSIVEWTKSTTTGKKKNTYRYVNVTSNFSYFVGTGSREGWGWGGGGESGRLSVM